MCRAREPTVSLSTSRSPSVLVQHTSIWRQEKPNERTDKPPRCEPPERAGARRACMTALRLQSDANRPWAHLPPHALLDGFELRHICFGFGIQVTRPIINRQSHYQSFVDFLSRKTVVIPGPKYTGPCEGADCRPDSLAGEACGVRGCTWRA